MTCIGCKFINLTGFHSPPNSLPRPSKSEVIILNTSRLETEQHNLYHLKHILLGLRGNCASSSFADNVQFVLLRMGKAGMF